MKEMKWRREGDGMREMRWDEMSRDKMGSEEMR
jgi:hypothetical protein